MSKFDEHKRDSVYISGPMTGFEDYNKKGFYDTEKKLRARGFVSIINPVHIGEMFGYDKSHTFYMRKSISKMMDADVVYVFGDYKRSKGVKLEVEIAHLLDIPVFYEEYND